MYETAILRGVQMLLHAKSAVPTDFKCRIVRASRLAGGHAFVVLQVCGALADTIHIPPDWPTIPEPIFAASAGDTDPAFLLQQAGVGAVRPGLIIDYGART